MKINSLFLKTLFLLSLFTFPIFICTAQTENVIISGFIKDASSGENIIGANIVLYKDTLKINKVPYKAVTSNKFGFFAIPKVVKGNYFIIISSIGYKVKVEELNVTIEKGTLNANFDLQPMAVELNEVIISAKKESKSQISSIDISPEVIQKLPTFSGEVDLFKTLQTIPGIKTSSEISRGLYIRGGSPDQTLTLVDGTIVYNPTHLGNFSSTFNSNAIQNINLIKGAFPAEYGGRLSSVLDVKLRSGTKERDKAKIGLGLFNSYLMLEGPLRENSTYMIFGRTMYYDLIQNKLYKKSNLPRYNFKDLNAKLTYTLSESNVVSISGMLTNDDIYSPADSNNLKYDIGWENKSVTLNWLKINSNSLFLNNSVSYTNYKFRSLIQDNTKFGDVNNYFASSNLNDFYIKTNADIYWNDNNIFKIGGELAVHSYDLIYTDIYDPLIEKDENSITPVFATEASMFAQNDFTLQEKFHANVGGRLYYFNNSKYLNFEPRISLSYEISKYITLKSAYAIAHQFLHLIIRNDISLPTDLWYPSTSKINPSKSAQYVFGLESFLFDKEYLISVETYYKDMKNIYEFDENIILNKDTELEELFTKGEGEAYGVEFFVNKTFGIFTGWIGYTLSWTKRQFSEINNGKIFYPRYDRRHDISLALTFKLNEKIDLGLTWVYATGQGYTIPTGQYSFQIPPFGTQQIQYDFVARNSYRMPDYHKLDINFNYKFKLFSLPSNFYVSLLNVYNRKNPFAYYLSKENSNNTVMKQLTLFPFIPSIGLNVEF